MLIIYINMLYTIDIQLCLNFINMIFKGFKGADHESSFEKFI